MANLDAILLATVWSIAPVLTIIDFCLQPSNQKRQQVPTYALMLVGSIVPLVNALMIVGLSMEDIPRSVTARREEKQLLADGIFKDGKYYFRVMGEVVTVSKAEIYDEEEDMI